MSSDIDINNRITVTLFSTAVILAVRDNTPRGIVVAEAPLNSREEIDSLISVLEHAGNVLFQSREEQKEKRSIEIGSTVKVKRGFLERESVVYDVREYNNKTYGLLYMRDGDGPIAGWYDLSDIIVVGTICELPPEELAESINYKGPWCVEKHTDPELAWESMKEDLDKEQQKEKGDGI